MPPPREALIAGWRARGARRSTVHGHVFVIDQGSAAPRVAPLLVLHGAPTCSLAWRRVVSALTRFRRTVLFDLLGSGHSDKPDLRYSVGLHADTALAVASKLGLGAVVLLAHDIGVTVAGEVLRRQMEGVSKLSVEATVIASGSIYADQTPFTASQRTLLALPDERLELVMTRDRRRAGLVAALRPFFSPAASVDAEELDALCEMVLREDGDALLPRTIRYIEDRLANERRYTGALEEHPGPIAAVWGADDPIAVVSMVETLRAARPDLRVTVLEHVGHFPMLEAPEQFGNAIVEALGALLPDGPEAPWSRSDEQVRA
jgi:pimeloyl-ACP methyl ester carboxylesterase